jgi:hypothetical protein
MKWGGDLHFHVALVQINVVHGLLVLGKLGHKPAPSDVHEKDMEARGGLRLPERAR